MLDFVKNAFRQGLEIILWLNLILWAITGAILLSMGRDDDKQFLYGLLGLILGGVVGMLYNIIFGGFIATILNIDNNVAKLVNMEHKGTGGVAKIQFAKNNNSNMSERVHQIGKDDDPELANLLNQIGK